MINVNHLTKRFGKFTALEQITCTIPNGCVYGMVGSNGAGKSTFLRILSGIYKPCEGNVLYDGQPVWENPSVKGKIAFIPDNLFFLGNCTLNRMRSLYSTIFKNFDNKRFHELITSFGLNPHTLVSTLSKGMRRQGAIILALSSRPEYMFFDETFDGLDPVMRNYVKTLIAEDTVQRGSTAIITSHSLRELEDMCDQLALLHKGGMALENDVENLKTTQFRVQIAFSRPFDQSDFKDMNIIHFSKHGSVANVIIRGQKEQTIERLKSMNPEILDILPLSLEEVFTYEMEALGYGFKPV